MNIELPEDLVVARDEANVTVTAIEAEIVTLEGAEEVDKDAVKAKKVELREAKKAVKTANTAITRFEVKARKEANKMPEQNGVRRPKPLTKCGQAWALADKLSAELGQPTPIAHLVEHGVAEGLNEGNIRAEYVRWRKFNGVTGRVTMPKTPEQIAEEEEKERLKAEKAQERKDKAEAKKAEAEAKKAEKAGKKAPVDPMQLGKDSEVEVEPDMGHAPVDGTTI